ncbi:hypothetical protein D049_4589 [Vibrio parahaemolyticus VPTS-2010]|nr:hypothetical protein D049_4589 [Vibrio parahaemolyticus VPTS-2010]
MRPLLLASLEPLQASDRWYYDKPLYRQIPLQLLGMSPFQYGLLRHCACRHLSAQHLR